MKKFSKVLSVVLAIFLIAGLLIFVNSFVGNPVSKYIATQSATKYIENNYSDLDLQHQTTNYNFKFQEYVVFFQSKTSIDIAFMVSTDSFGKIIGDNYPQEVENNFTTWRRLENELREKGNTLLRDGLEYDITYASFTFNGKETEQERKEKLTKDMPLDIENPPFPIVVNINLQHEDLSYENAAKILKEVQNIIQENAIPISEYNLEIQEKNQDDDFKKLSLYDIPAKMILSENLAQELKEFDQAKGEKIQ